MYRRIINYYTQVYLNNTKKYGEEHAYTKAALATVQHYEEKLTA